MIVNPFDALRDRLAAVLADVRYARRQIIRHRDVGRALDALDRVTEALEGEATEDAAIAPPPSNLDTHCAVCGAQLYGHDLETGLCHRHHADRDELAALLERF
jgi:hypothetical protein